jgi:hypothetical protein
MYNADETCLFHRVPPEGCLGYKYATLSGSQNAVDRVTMLWCSNRLGTGKRKYLVFGKSLRALKVRIDCHFVLC